MDRGGKVRGIEDDESSWRCEEGETRRGATPAPERLHFLGQLRAPARATVRGHADMVRALSNRRGARSRESGRARAVCPKDRGDHVIRFFVFFKLDGYSYEAQMVFFCVISRFLRDWTQLNNELTLTTNINNDTSETAREYKYQSMLTRMAACTCIRGAHQVSRRAYFCSSRGIPAPKTSCRLLRYNTPQRCSPPAPASPPPREEQESSAPKR